MKSNTTMDINKFPHLYEALAAARGEDGTILTVCDEPIQSYLRFVVGANSSVEATRKIKAFFDEYFSPAKVMSIEIESFKVLLDKAQAVVLI